MIKNSKTNFGALSKILHSIIALFFIFQYTFIYWKNYLPKDDPFKGTLMGWHKSFGMTVFFLAAFYLIWFFINIKPKLNSMHWILKLLAKSVHYALFFCMLAMPISGYLMSTGSGYGISWFGLFEWPKLIGVNKPLAGSSHDFHLLLANVVIFLTSIHILAALKHHFIDKDNTLKRMLPFCNSDN